MDQLEPVESLESLEALPPAGQVLLTILYSATAIISFFGNSLVLIVLMLGTRLRMRRQSVLLSSSVNVAAVNAARVNNGRDFKSVVSEHVSSQPVSYKQRQIRSDNLRSYLINLAWSDLSMALFSIPFTYTDFLLGRWIWPATLCRLASTINVVAITVSVYTMVLISLDRYFAIVRPLLSSTSFVSRHSSFLIAVTWLFAFTIASPQLLVTGVRPFTVQNETYYVCQEQWPSNLYSDIYSTLIILITFAFPLCLLLIIYGKIARRIANRDQKLFQQLSCSVSISHDEHNHANGYRHRSSQKAIRMIITIIVCFFICWSPIQVFNFIVWTCRLDQHHEDSGSVLVNLYVGAFFTFHFLAVSHSIVNPIIYCYMCANFQESAAYFEQNLYTKK